MNQEPEKKETSEEELKELKEVIRKLEELQEHQKQVPKKRPRRLLLAIEFGGVFHHNRIVNFIFGFILNFTFAYFVIEIFDFAVYNDIINMLALIFVYSVIEEIFRTYILMKHFSLIIKSFGTIFFFGYIIIFFILDQYIFIKTFSFRNGTLLAFFVLIFTLTRYFFGTYLRRYLRKQEMR